MTDDRVIDVQGMGKRFRLRASGTRTFKSAALDLLKVRGAGKRDFWALQDMSFTVGSGETLGIIGYLTAAVMGVWLLASIIRHRRF